MNNAVANEYNYETGSGMDSFMSRSLDAVSWQNTLSASVNTLGTLPVGIMPTTATPTNYDLSQVSGSLGGAISMGGGSNSGAGGGSTGKVMIDGTNGRISIMDENNNEILRLGNISSS